MKSWVLGFIAFALHASLSGAEAQPTATNPGLTAASPAPTAESARPVDPRELAPCVVRSADSEKTHHYPAERAIEVSIDGCVVIPLDKPLAELQQTERRGKHLGLFIDDTFFSDVRPEPTLAGADAAQFRLTRSKTNFGLWSTVLLHHSPWGARCGYNSGGGEILLTAAYEDGSAVSRTLGTCLKFFPNRLLAREILIINVLAIAFAVWLALRSSLVRDVGIPPEDERAPYSLARLQFLVWTLTVVTAYCVSIAALGNIHFPLIPTGPLTLLVIVGCTAIASAAIDTSAPNEYKTARLRYQNTANRIKRLEVALKDDFSRYSTLRRNRKPLPPWTGQDPERIQALLQVEKSRLARLRSRLGREIGATNGLLTDILSDSGGFALHRLQLVAWSLLLWAVFMINLISTTSLPDFDAYWLAVLAISCALYLGVKLRQPLKASGDPAFRDLDSLALKALVRRGVDEAMTPPALINYEGSVTLDVFDPSGKSCVREFADGSRTATVNLNGSYTVVITFWATEYKQPEDPPGSNRSRLSLSGGIRAASAPFDLRVEFDLNADYPAAEQSISVPTGPGSSPKFTLPFPPLNLAAERDGGLERCEIILFVYQLDTFCAAVSLPVAFETSQHP